MTQRGLVMDVQNNNIIIMTPDGRFRRVPCRGRYKIGDEYVFKNTISRQWLAVAAVLLLAIASVTLSLARPGVPVAYVTVDINPSVELAVSASQKVLAVEALNGEGAVLLEGLRLRGEPLSEALAKILSAAETLHFLDNENSVIVVTTTHIAKEAQREITDLAKTVSQVKANYVNDKGSDVSVTVVTANETVRNEARELGLSTGKYAVYLEAQSEGLELEVASLQDKGIVKALLDLNTEPGEILRRVELEADLALLAERVREKIASIARLEQSEMQNTEDIGPAQGDNGSSEDGTDTVGVEPNTGSSVTVTLKPDNKATKPKVELRPGNNTVPPPDEQVDIAVYMKPQPEEPPPIEPEDEEEDEDNEDAGSRLLQWLKWFSEKR